MLTIIAAVGAAINAILAAQPAFAIAAVVAIMAIGVVIALGGLVVITGAVTTVIAVAFRAVAERQQRYRAERAPNRLHGIVPPVWRPATCRPRLKRRLSMRPDTIEQPFPPDHK